MKRVSTALAILLIGAMISAGCQTGNTPVSRPDDEVRWRYPLENPRVRHVNTISTPADIGVTSGAWSRLVGTIFGKREFHLTRPQGLTVRDGILFVVDREQRRVHCFDQVNRHYWTLPRQKDRAMVSPVDLAVDGEGNCYVTDSALGSIFRFDSAGNWKETFHFTSLRRPTGIVFDDNHNRLYVADTIGHTIHAVSLHGETLFTFGTRGSGPGQLNFPVSLAMDLNGDILVNDAMNFRIERFNSDGDFLGAFGRVGDRPGCFAKPKGVAVDASEHVFVVDALFGNVQMFDESGRLLFVFGETGTETGEFWLPTGITVDRGGHIYVSDSYNSRVQVFELTGEG